MPAQHLPPWTPLVGDTLERHCRGVIPWTPWLRYQRGAHGVTRLQFHSSVQCFLREEEGNGLGIVINVASGWIVS